MRSTAPRTVVRRPKGPENKWTPEEDEVLAAAVNASGFKVCWRKIASSLPGRTNKSCRKRWIHSLDPTLKKGRWTAQEDKILLNAIKTHGTLWFKVAKHLPGRTDDQAAKRFREKLDPSIARTPWTDEEDDVLIRMWKKVGKRWNLISRELNGRPAVHCRNRWQSLLRIGKVDGSEQGLDFDYTAVCNDDTLADDEVPSSPIEPVDTPRPSTASSSSSSDSSSYVSTPLHTGRALESSMHRFSKEEEPENVDFMAMEDSMYQSFASSRAPSATSGFFDMTALDGGATSSQRLDHGLRIDPYAPPMPKPRADDAPFQFSMPPQHQQSTSKPSLFMVPHPNMRILSGSNQYSHASQHNVSDMRDENLFQFDFGQPPAQSPPSPFYPSSSYGSSPPPFHQMPPQHMVGPSPPQASHRLPQLQTNTSHHENNFMMTCPLVHCGFQSMNLIELWKHVTWDHVNASSIPPSSNHSHGHEGLASSRPPRFDLDMAPHFGIGAMKTDPAMMDYVERAVLDAESDGAHQMYHDSHKRPEFDLGALNAYGLGLQMDDFDAAVAAMGHGRPPIHIPSAV